MMTMTAGYNYKKLDYWSWIIILSFLQQTFKTSSVLVV